MDPNYQALRLELKEWEQSFALSNQGKKAGRGDIKQHPEIGILILALDTRTTC